MARAPRRQRAARHRRQHRARCSNTSEPDPAVQCTVRTLYRTSVPCQYGTRGRYTGPYGTLVWYTVRTVHCPYGTLSVPVYRTSIQHVYTVSSDPAQLAFGGAWLVGRGLPFGFARSWVRDRAWICRNLVSRGTAQFREVEGSRPRVANGVFWFHNSC